MPTLNIRCDYAVITLLVQLQHAGFGKNKTEVVLSALDLLSESSLIDVAKARMKKLDRAEADRVEAPAAVIAVAATPAEPLSAIQPGCEVCGAALEAGNSRFCPAHVPAFED